MKRKTAYNIKELLQVILLIIFLPILIPSFVFEWMTKTYFGMAYFINEKLYWIMQGKSTDVDVRLDRLLESKNTDNNTPSAMGEYLSR